MAECVFRCPCHEPEWCADDPAIGCDLCRAYHEPLMKRYDPDRPRVLQGLLNWLWLLWPKCNDRRPVGGVPTSCDRLRWHRSDHGFMLNVTWPKERRR